MKLNSLYCSIAISFLGMSTLYRTAVHSISTSVLRGRVLTATQLFIIHMSVILSHLCNELCEVVDSRPARLDITPVGGVDLVHGSKVVHAGEEDVDLDNVVKAGASGLKDGLEVLDAAVGVCLDVTRDEFASLGVLQGEDCQ